MAAVSVTGTTYLQDPTAVEEQGPYAFRFLVEGDSWMDRSSLLIGALPDFLAADMEKRGNSALLINIAKGGDTLRQISDVLKERFTWWLQQFQFDGILLSAGGNDFIDAAREPAPGEGILFNMADQPLPADGYDCVRQDALQQLVQNQLTPHFEAIYQAVRGSAKNADTPLFLNSYDTPTPRNAPAAKGVGPWLYTAYRKNHIHPSLWPTLTQGLFGQIEDTIQGWSKDRTHVHVVPTQGKLRPAVPGSVGRSYDWANEIHPNSAGWKTLASVWSDTVLKTMA